MSKTDGTKIANDRAVGGSELGGSGRGAITHNGRTPLHALVIIVIYISQGHLISHLSRLGDVIGFSLRCELENRNEVHGVSTMCSCMNGKSHMYPHAKS